MKTMVLSFGWSGSCKIYLVVDMMLTHYACYLIAQNGDPPKEAKDFANKITNTQ